MKPLSEATAACAVPRPEYPRPQFVREGWMNLNGQWDFLFDFGNSGMDRKLWEDDALTAAMAQSAMPTAITVPFCPESKLSGIGYTDWIAAVWYRRRFTLRDAQAQSRVLLHFGAVDYHSIIFVNGEKAGEHKGGYASFTLDITALVHPGENTVVVYAEDNNRSGCQPCGKQARLFYSNGCDYTRTTGIWQTVWLEFTPHTALTSIRITPDLASCAALLDIETNGGNSVQAVATYDGRAVAKQTIALTGKRAHLELKLSELHLWDIGQPALYDLCVTLDTGDTVKSYFGMRSVALSDKALLLNGRPVFLRTVLDQGFNPDGIYTAPNDAFLRRDIELSMALGMNGARLHQRVFEERTFYWADKLGYLVWGEYANTCSLADARGIGYFLPEWMETVRRDYSHPSIIGWAPQNESYWTGEVDPICQKVFYEVTKEMDRTRPVIDASGGVHFKTDMYDIHDYEQDPAVLGEKFDKMKDDPSYVPNPIHQEQLKLNVYEDQPVWVSEYGGAFWNPDVPGGWGYGKTPESEEAFLARYEGLTNVLLHNPRVCGFCYTQLTDIEQEQNGLYRYDRSRKFSDKIYDGIRRVNEQTAAIEK